MAAAAGPFRRGDRPYAATRSWLRRMRRQSLEDVLEVDDWRLPWRVLRQKNGVRRDSAGREAGQKSGFPTCTRNGFGRMVERSALRIVAATVRGMRGWDTSAPPLAGPRHVAGQSGGSARQTIGQGLTSAACTLAFQRVGLDLDGLSIALQSTKCTRQKLRSMHLNCSIKLACVNRRRVARRSCTRTVDR